MSGQPVTIVKTGDPPTELFTATTPGYVQGTVTATSTPPTGASATQVQGTAADGAAVVGSPVRIGGKDGSGNTQDILTTTGGRFDVAAVVAVGGADAQSNTIIGVPTSNGDALTIGLQSLPMIFNETSWDRARSVGTGNNVTGTGLTAFGSYGQYNTIANQPSLTTGKYSAAQLDAASNQKCVTGAPPTANILAGYLQHTATTGAATVITVPAGKTFIGKVSVSVAASKAAAATGNGLVSAVIATAGTNVTPAAGTIFAVSARIGANAATGTVGTQGSNFGSQNIIVNAPAGNAVTVTLASTLTSTTEGAVDCSIYGTVQ